MIEGRYGTYTAESYSVLIECRPYNNFGFYGWINSTNQLESKCLLELGFVAAKMRDLYLQYGGSRNAMCQQVIKLRPNRKYLLRSMFLDDIVRDFADVCFPIRWRNQCPFVDLFTEVEIRLCLHANQAVRDSLLGSIHSFEHQ